MIELVFPYHKGNGANNSTFKIFTSKPFFPYDVVRVQKVDLHVRAVKKIEDDFLEEYYELDVVIITTMFPGAFMIFDYTKSEITLMKTKGN